MKQDYRALIADRGDVQLYRPAESNHCPSCGGANWIVGRVTAECGFCSRALPLLQPIAATAIHATKNQS